MYSLATGIYTYFTASQFKEPMARCDGITYDKENDLLTSVSSEGGEYIYIIQTRGLSNFTTAFSINLRRGHVAIPAVTNDGAGNLIFTAGTEEFKTKFENLRGDSDSIDAYLFWFNPQEVDQLDECFKVKNYTLEDTQANMLGYSVVQPQDAIIQGIEGLATEINTDVFVGTESQYAAGFDLLNTNQPKKMCAETKYITADIYEGRNNTIEINQRKFGDQEFYMFSNLDGSEVNYGEGSMSIQNRNSKVFLSPPSGSGGGSYGYVIQTCDRKNELTEFYI